MSVTLRPVRPDDERVLTEMLAAVRRPTFAGPGLDAAAVSTLAWHDAEMHDYECDRDFPHSAWETITVDGEPVGRLITHTTPERIVLVDIFVAPEHQRRGIGSLVLGAELERADARPIEVRVDRGSPAEAWCAAFGFEPADGDELQLSMIRS
jgi:GNAT superfamily N-acetyltransferase